MTWLAWTAFGLGLFVAAAIGLVAFGASRWAGSTRALLAQLEATRLPETATRYNAGELEDLPAPVQRYFRAVLKDGQPIVTEATVEHTGTFRLSLGGEQWRPFTSQQRVVTRAPGFVWNGHVAILPGVAVHVHDAYIAGIGILEPSVLGLYSLADLHGGGDLALGELMRYFIEAAWYPTALLPSQGVRWVAVDEHSAKATLVDRSLSVTMLVSFDDAGLIRSARFEARGAMVGKTVVQMPWEGRWSNYQERDGIRVPLTAEVAWLTPQGRQPYFRGTVTVLSYGFAP